MLAYTYFGYPVVIGALARLFPARSGHEVEWSAAKVTICLSVYNGASFLPAKVESLQAQDYPAEQIEILIFCDGCPDESERIARSLAASPSAGGRIRVLSAGKRQGKPSALNALRAEARGDLLLLCDVRQPFSTNVVSALVGAMSDERVGCATGNVVASGGAGSGVYWRYEKWIRRQESRFRGVVGVNGAIAMLRRRDLMLLPENLILDDVYIPMTLAMRGLRAKFVNEAEAYDTAFEDEQEFRRKVRTLAGNYQLFSIMPALLVPFRNPVWFETVSHKILRLIAPWLMLVLAGTSLASSLSQVGMVAVWMRALVATQVVFYGAAVVGRRAGRAAGIARTFLVLNVAAVVGLVRYLRGRQRVTW
jgi:cellulose synthase/poly-beta-1,6-N-acetylglucosamine synthase-like glycosyltransferase